MLFRKSLKLLPDEAYGSCQLASVSLTVDMSGAGWPGVGCTVPNARLGRCDLSPMGTEEWSHLTARKSWVQYVGLLLSTSAGYRWHTKRIGRLARRMKQSERLWLSAGRWLAIRRFVGLASSVLVAAIMN